MSACCMTAAFVVVVMGHGLPARLWVWRCVTPTGLFSCLGKTANFLRTCLLHAAQATGRLLVN
jgi:hypothetical protein